MASYRGTVPIMAGDFSMSARRNAAVLPLFDRSMMASAPELQRHVHLLPLLGLAGEVARDP